MKYTKSCKKMKKNNKLKKSMLIAMLNNWEKSLAKIRKNSSGLNKKLSSHHKNSDCGCWSVFCQSEKFYFFLLLILYYGWNTAVKELILVKIWGYLISAAIHQTHIALNMWFPAYLFSWRVLITTYVCSIVAYSIHH